MKLMLNVTMSGSAFDGFEENTKSGNEVARILHKAANALQDCDINSPISCPLMDINGNKCGELKIIND